MGITIKELEQKLHALQTSSRKSKNDIENIKELQRNIKQQKELNKISAMMLEENNLSHLVIFESDKGFHKLAGNSALFYAGNIATRIGRRFTLRHDDDRYAYSKSGVISNHYTDEFVELLYSIKLSFNAELSKNGLKVFDFPQPFTEKDLESFQNQLEQEKNYINKTVLPNSPIPTLYTYLRELNFLIFNSCKNMQQFGREVFGNTVMEASNEMLLCYMEIANGNVDIMHNLLCIAKKAKFLKNQIKNIEICNLMGSCKR